MPQVSPWSSGCSKRPHSCASCERIQRTACRFSISMSSIACSASGTAPLPLELVSTTGLSIISG